MFSTTRSRVRALSVAGMAVVVAGIGAVTFNASAAEVAAPAAVGPDARAVSIPKILEGIKPPAKSRPIGAYVVTTGTQNYTCVVAAGASSGSFSAPSTPDAQLLGTGGRIHHYGGPTWESLRDGSLVTATKKAAGPDRPGTIPELLLQVVTHSDAQGVLTKADWINRLYTSGGAAPTTSCTSGQVAKVPYKAVYVFWDDPAI
jgi:hypothetical protein